MLAGGKQSHLVTMLGGADIYTLLVGRLAAGHKKHPLGRETRQHRFRNGQMPPVDGVKGAAKYSQAVATVKVVAGG
jgi:hypothetical protein